MTRERKLVRFAAGLAAVLLGGELLARVFEPQLSATSDRISFKAALFQRQGDTERILIGSSRFNDGLKGKDLRAFNASVPSSSLKVQARLFDSALVHPGLKLAVLEVSPEQMEGTGALPQTDDALFALVRQRRAFALENWPRLWALPFASHFDGSEWFRDRWLTETWAENKGLPQLPAAVRPTRIVGARAGAISEAVYEWAKMAERGRARGVRTAFVAPPVDADRKEAQCGGKFEAMLKQLATASGSPVLDYGCIDLPPELFISNAHLSALGRAWFTRSLATELDAL